MIRRPPRSTLDRSSAASDVYKRQVDVGLFVEAGFQLHDDGDLLAAAYGFTQQLHQFRIGAGAVNGPVSYTHLRAHETVLNLVCRLLLEKKKKL